MRLPSILNRTFWTLSAEYSTRILSFSLSDVRWCLIQIRWTKTKNVLKKKIRRCPLIGAAGEACSQKTTPGYTYLNKPTSRWFSLTLLEVEGDICTFGMTAGTAELHHFTTTSFILLLTRPSIVFNAGSKQTLSSRNKIT